MQLTPERLVAGGTALARGADGRVVFVDGGLPGEELDVEVDAAKKDFANAHVVAVLEASPDRVVPPCAHRRAGCGGCDWMHLHPLAQHDAKVGIVVESLARSGGFDRARVDELVRRGGAVPPIGYRTTIRVVGDEHRHAGYRMHSSHDVIAVDSCPVAVAPLGALLRGLQVPPGLDVTLRVSVATGGVNAWWEGPLDAVGGLPPQAFVGDRAWLLEEVAGRTLRVSATSFFQSGVAAAELLVDAVSRAAPECATAGHVADVYGGVGLFAVTVAESAGHVTVVESSKSACADARRNLRDRAATVIRSDVGHWRPGAQAGKMHHEGSDVPIDVVIADPARPGLGKPGTAAIVAASAPVVVLVSCDPVSFARDARLLGESGYDLISVEVLDLFPQTHHVETVSRFELRS
jgi:23S rRNA (uracil1939-C5)-methyltransferase